MLHRRARRLLAGLVAPILALAGAAVLAADQEARAVGSWIVASGPEPGAKTERHVAMTLSTQGSGTIGLRCLAKKPSVVLGLNKGALGAAIGTRVAVEHRTGEEDFHPASAVAVSDEVVEFDEETSRGLIVEVAKAPAFSFRLKVADSPAVLVFRPALTRTAVGDLAKACGIPL